jgi:hypothetical protein
MSEATPDEGAAGARRWAARGERVALAAMGLGLALMLLVPSSSVFRAGFFVVLAATVAQIVCAHLRTDAA